MINTNTMRAATNLTRSLGDDKNVVKINPIKPAEKNNLSVKNNQAENIANGVTSVANRRQQYRDRMSSGLLGGVLTGGTKNVRNISRATGPASLSATAALGGTNLLTRRVRG